MSVSVAAVAGEVRSPVSRESFATSREEITVSAKHAIMKPAPKNHVSFATGEAAGRPPVPPPPPPIPKPPPSERCRRTVTIKQSARMRRITRMIFCMCACLLIRSVVRARRYGRVNSGLWRGCLMGSACLMDSFIGIWRTLKRVSGCDLVLRRFRCFGRVDGSLYGAGFLNITGQTIWPM